MNYSSLVMAGLVPAIHVFMREKQDVDARNEAGHDGVYLMRCFSPLIPAQAGMQIFVLGRRFREDDLISAAVSSR
jgi:hypothetical protein